MYIVTESQFTGRLLKEIRHHLPGAVILKFNDRVTAGIPDFCVVIDGRTSWWEVKVAPNKLTRLQAIMLKRMCGHCVTLIGRDRIQIEGKIYDFNGAVAAIGLRACV